VIAYQWQAFHSPIFPVLAVAVAAVARRRPQLSITALAGLPVLAIPTMFHSVTASMAFVANYGWLALILYPIVRHERDAGLLLITVWLPALAAGLVTGLSSSNYGGNFGVGFFPATIVTSVFLIWSVNRLRRDVAEGLAVLPIAVSLALLIALQLSSVYRDGRLSSLGDRVGSGPFAGLITSAAKRDFLKQASADFGAATTGCRVLFFNDFPAGYLLADGQPDTNSTWISAVANERAAERYQRTVITYFRAHGFPNIVVVMTKTSRGARRSSQSDRSGLPLMAMVAGKQYHPALIRPRYEIFTTDHGESCVRSPRA
jgi:hypothetical protein